MYADVIDSGDWCMSTTARRRDDRRAEATAQIFAYYREKMAFSQRQSRSPHSHVKQVLDRLHRETGAHAFATICDRISIPRDLRPGLLEQLVTAGYITSEDDQVRLTEEGKQVAPAPVTSPDDPTQNPSPSDRESRVRTPNRGKRT